LTVTELNVVREVLGHDLGEVVNDAFIPLDEEPEVCESVSCTDAEAIDEPLSPVSAASKPSTHAIHAVFNPEVRGQFVRQFPWGQADVMNPDTSDFVALRETILREARVSTLRVFR
jgi:septin family protein